MPNPQRTDSFTIEAATRLYGGDVFTMRRKGLNNWTIAERLSLNGKIAQAVMDRIMSIIDGPRMGGRFKIAGKGYFTPQEWHYKLAIDWMFGLSVEEISFKRDEPILRVKNGLDQVRRCLGEPDPDRPLADYIHPIYTNGPSGSKPHHIGF